MIYILMILHLLTSTAILGKPVHIVDEEDFPRYAYNYAIDSLFTKDSKLQPDLKDSNQLNGAYSLLNPLENLPLVEYPTDNYGALNTIVQKLAANLTPLPLIGPLSLPFPPINHSINPLNYGFGAPSTSSGPAKVTVTGSSIPWDRRTRSYGGWVPLQGPVRKVPSARIVSRKYVNGRLYKVRSKPISLRGKAIIIKKRPAID